MARQICGPGPGIGLALVAAALLGAACGGNASASSAARGRPAARPAPVRDRPDGPSPSYFNPGGMWLPSQMPRQTDVLRRLGIDMDPARLYPASPLLQAIVDLGDCSAAFVSPEGLLITGHHCAQHTLPALTGGFLARTRGEERWAGPAARALVTQKMEEVTRAMTAGLEAIVDDAARHQELQARQKKLVDECEGGRPHVRCEVTSFLDGALWLRVRSLEIRDIRLVHAPPTGIAAFGGAKESAMWPRHAGDFAFYRAYVGPDGAPADHSDKNVPYRSHHRLAIASKPLREGDLVVVAGYPRATGRLGTAADLEEVSAWRIPREIERAEALLAALRDVGQRDAAAAAFAQPMIAATEASLAHRRAALEALVAAGAADRRHRAEDALAAWIEQDADRRARWGDVVGQVEQLQADRRGARERDVALAELRDARMFAAAAEIVRMAEERSAPDADRDPAYQARNWRAIEARVVDLGGRRYHREVDGAVLRLALVRAARHLEHNRDWLERVLDRRAMAAAAAGDGEAIEREMDRVVRRIYAGSKLDRQDIRVKLLRGATRAQLARSADPMIRLAGALRPVDKEIEDSRARLAGAAALVRPRFMAALRAFHGELAPDANGTLRIAFGTVRGFRPRPDAGVLRPFTTLRELVARHWGGTPFDVPDDLTAAAERGVGPYRDHKLDDLPVDFLSDADTTSGSSGSATLNARGELCGLVFDNTLESAAGEWMYSADTHRSIHVDLRYVSWIMDAVDGGDSILAEMGVTPSL